MTEKKDIYESTRAAWEDIWADASIKAELEAINYARSQETIRAWLPFLNREDLHLEAGSGLSAVVITLRGRGYKVQGLDYAFNALRDSRQYDPSLPLTAGDVHRLPFPDDCFGSYLSFGVLEHFEHGMLPALQEAHRVLKPGGALVLTIPYPNVLHRALRIRRKLAGNAMLTDERFYESAYSRRELEALVAAAGFEVELAQATSHEFTLWGLGGVFRAPGYYRTSALAEALGGILKWLLPWPFNFTTLIVARKPGDRAQLSYAGKAMQQSEERYRGD